MHFVWIAIENESYLKWAEVFKIITWNRLLHMLFALWFGLLPDTIKSNWPRPRLWMMNNLTNMHIKSSPAHIRLERKMTSIIWQKDFSVIVSFSCGQISSFDSRFDGTWILNEKQFRSKIYVFSWKFIFSVKNVEKSKSVSSRVCFIMLNSDGWISSEGSNELSLSLIFEASHIICYILVAY